ncbi:MAG: hypothetical protein CMG81_03305 [Marinobacter sp.]|mgnify:FL=1|nr:hypothetical protein [Marinobacter sp.]
MMERLMFVTAMLLLSLTAQAGSVVRCVDPSTGAVTFTDGGCRQGATSERVEVFQGNTMDSRQAYRDMQKLEAMRMEEEARRLEKRRRMEDLQRYQAQQRAAERQKDLCDRITRPHKGAQNGQLTASQRDAMMRCAGISVPERSYGSAPSAPMPAPAAPPAPTHITHCDASGCWDNMGGRYNRGAGPTHIHQSGRPCQMIGGQMHCP